MTKKIFILLIFILCIITTQFTCLAEEDFIILGVNYNEICLYYPETNKIERINAKNYGQRLSSSKDKSKIVYYRHVESCNVSPDIFLFDLKENKEIRLTEGKSSWNPALSDDGSTVAYVSAEGEGLFVIDSDGANKRKIYEDSVYYNSTPDISPDGKEIVLAVDGQKKLARIKSDGSKISFLLSNSDEYIYSPLWSPNGEKVLFVVASKKNPRKLSTYNIKTNSKQEIFKDEGNSSKLPKSGFKWLPNGKEVVFIYKKHENNNNNIYVINKDGTNLKQITEGMDVKCFDISPDGEKIAFRVDSRKELFIVNIDGTCLQEIELENVNSIKEVIW